MLNLPFYLLSLRWTVSTAFMLGTAPNYFMLWMLWRVATLPLPGRVYEIGDDFLYGLYQKMILFFFEHSNNLEVITYGDAEEAFKKKENYILLCNHQSTVDWLVADMLTIRQGTIGYIRYILKDGLKWFPLYGFYFRQHSCIYVKRAGKFKEDKAKHQLDLVARKNTPFVMVIFPEGTRYNVNLPDVINRSRKFAAEKGLPQLKYQLVPRTRAFELCVNHLRNKTAAIYDLTIGFANTIDPLTGQRLLSPGLPEVLQSSGLKVHLHLKRTDINELPQENAELQKWLMKQFEDKDRLLDTFFCPNNKPLGDGDSIKDTVANIEQTFGPDGQRNVLPLSSTLPAVMFFAALNAPILLTKTGRALYWKSAVFGTLFCWVWVAIRS